MSTSQLSNTIGSDSQVSSSATMLSPVRWSKLSWWVEKFDLLVGEDHRQVGMGHTSPCSCRPDVANSFRRDAKLGWEQRCSALCSSLALIEDVDAQRRGQSDSPCSWAWDCLVKLNVSVSKLWMRSSSCALHDMLRWQHQEILAWFLAHRAHRCQHSLSMREH